MFNSLSFNKNTKKVISSSIGCQTRTVKSAMNVEKSSTLSGADTTVVFVARYSATGVATWKFLENSWGTQVKNKMLSIKYWTLNRDGGRYNLPAIWTRLVRSHVMWPDRQFIVMT